MPRHQQTLAFDGMTLKGTIIRYLAAFSCLALVSYFL